MFTSVAGFGTDTYPESKLKTLYQIFGSQKFNNDMVIWEHGYDYDDDDDVIFPFDEGLGCNNPTDIPSPDSWLPGDALHLAVQSNDLASIPDMMGPLPPELTHTILSDLTLHELIQLTEIPSATRYYIPNLIWKRFFDVRSNLGFLSSPAGANPGGSWYHNLLTSSNNPNWYSLCLLGLKYAASGSPAVSNRRRIWKLCLRLSNLVDEIHDSTKRGFENHVDYPFLGQSPISDLRLATFDMPKNNLYTTSVIPCIVQTIEPPDMERATEAFEDMRAVSTRGCVTHILVDEIGVTFTGEERLRYVTGLSFFWRGKPVGVVGLVSQRRMNRVLLAIERRVFNMAIAVNQHGIVDISITPGSFYEIGPQEWLGGGSNMDGAAVMRRNFILPPKFKSSGIFIVAAVVDFEVYKIKRFGIFSPQLVILGPRESAICHNLWQSGPPTMSLDQSLNLSCYCGVLDHTAKSTESGSIEFVLPLFQDKVKAGPVKPFSAIDLQDELPNRFTCWVGSWQLFVGLSFSTTNEDGTVAKKWAFGSESGVPIDFPLNPEQEERVRYIDLTLLPQSSGDIAIDDIREHPKISGITPTPTSDIKSVEQVVTPENAQFSLMVAAPNCYNDEPKGTLIDMFVSHVDLTDCKAIVVYIKDEPEEEDIYAYHITGLSVKFHGEKDKELSGNPRYLGRISAGDRCETIELDVDKGEMLEKIVVCRGNIVEKESAILAMEFHTTLNRRINIGELDFTRGGVRGWNLGACNNIVWAFNHNLEWIRGFASKEEWSRFFDRLGAYGIILA
ncbi:hypothetical protein TWF281_002210 [Arthrobotrys megalospora]